MARPIITITETVTRTYSPSKAELEDLDLPIDIDALRELDSEELGVALIDSDLEDRYAVEDREIEITQPQASPGN